MRQKISYAYYYYHVYYYIMYIIIMQAKDYKFSE